MWYHEQVVIASDNVLYVTVPRTTCIAAYRQKAHPALSYGSTMFRFRQENGLAGCRQTSRLWLKEVCYFCKFSYKCTYIVKETLCYDFWLHQTKTMISSRNGLCWFNPPAHPDLLLKPTLYFIQTLLLLLIFSFAAVIFFYNHLKLLPNIKCKKRVVIVSVGDTAGFMSLTRALARWTIPLAVIWLFLSSKTFRPAVCRLRPSHSSSNPG